MTSAERNKGPNGGNMLLTGGGWWNSKKITDVIWGWCLPSSQKPLTLATNLQIRMLAAPPLSSAHKCMYVWCFSPLPGIYFCSLFSWMAEHKVNISWILCTLVPLGALAQNIFKCLCPQRLLTFYLLCILWMQDRCHMIIFIFGSKLNIKNWMNNGRENLDLQYFNLYLWWSELLFVTVKIHMVGEKATHLLKYWICQILQMHLRDSICLHPCLIGAPTTCEHVLRTSPVSHLDLLRHSTWRLKLETFSFKGSLTLQSVYLAVLTAPPSFSIFSLNESSFSAPSIQTTLYKNKSGCIS